MTFAAVVELVGPDTAERLRQTRALRRYLGTQPAAENQEGGDQLELAPLDR